MAQPLPDMNEYAVKFMDIQEACSAAHELFFKELQSAFGVQIPASSLKKIDDLIYDFSRNCQDEYESSPSTRYEDLDLEIFPYSEIILDDIAEFYIPPTWLDETPDKVFELFIQQMFRDSDYNLTTAEFQELFETCNIDDNLLTAFWISAQDAIQGFYYKQFQELGKEHPNLPFYPNFLSGYDIYYYYEPSTC